MCFAIPGKIEKIEGDMAIVDYSGEKRKANCSFVEVEEGDYVIVQNKFVIEKVSEKDAVTAIKEWKEALK